MEAERSSNPLLPWLNAASTVVTIVVNGLANSLALNGVTTGEVSDRYPTYFVPAGYVFSIWGVIYLGLLGFSVFQLLPSEETRRDMERIGYRYIATGVANIIWLFLWHYGVIVLTPVFMLALLGLLISIYTRLGVGLRGVPPLRRWLVDIPFSIYLGWISVATIANIAAALYALGWTGGAIGGQFWAFLMLLVAAGLAIYMCLMRRDRAFALVIVWAAVGIAVKQGGTTLVSPAALVLAIIVAVVVFVTALGSSGGILTPRA
ncbi:MAG: tryptophan-rich sensory protein [Chloroflexi bacterium]|nr:tryptophan-rich sensory protein [Chloroflexota bacterium]